MDLPQADVANILDLMDLADSTEFEPSPIYGGYIEWLRHSKRSETSFEPPLSETRWVSFFGLHLGLIALSTLGGILALKQLSNQWTYWQ